jgi:hypothetical protein
MCRKPKSEKRAPHCRRLDDFLVAALDEFVGDALLQPLALRNREHVRLALGAGVGHQRIGFELSGLAQHGPCHLDRIVEGELVDDVDRSAVETGQPLGELGAGCHFDLVGKAGDDFAECPDLVIAEPARDHQIGGVPQRALAAFGRPA